MMSVKRSALFKTIHTILSQSALLEGQLVCEGISTFRHHFDMILDYNEIASNKAENSREIIAKLAIVLEILKKNHKEVSLAYLFKKIMFIHAFLSKGSRYQPVCAEMAQLMEKQINKILKEEIPVLKEPVRHSKLTKVIGYIREISRSKDSINRSGMNSVGKQQDKSSIKEFFKIIMEPHCYYLLKIFSEVLQLQPIQNGDVYKLSKVSAYFWKILNWAKGISSKAQQFNTFYRSFKDEMQGIGVYLLYVISMDVSIYYDLLKCYIDSKLIEWRRKYEDIQKLGKIDKDKYRLEVYILGKNPQLIEMKRQVEELAILKEDINFIYMSKNFNYWISYFCQCPSYVYKEKNDHQDFLFLIKETQELKSLSKSKPLIGVSLTRQNSFRKPEYPPQQAKIQSSLTTELEDNQVPVKTKTVQPTRQIHLAITPTLPSKADSIESSTSAQEILRGNQKREVTPPPKEKKKNQFAEKRSKIMGLN